MIKLNYYPFEYNTPEVNMKIDNFFLAECEEIYFRLYRWKPYAVSIGVSQDKYKVCNVDYCNQKGIEIVKRITGGGAVYHKRDITYMFAAPLNFFEEKTVVGIYKKIAGILLAIFNSLNLNCSFAGKIDRQVRKDGMKKGIACFLLPSDYEILVEGKKIVGNALRIEKSRVLQHGSIAFEFDYVETAKVLNTSVERLKKRVISLKEVLPGLTLSEFEKRCIESLETYGFDVKVSNKPLPFKE